jgi:hypothetical protein
MRRFNLNRWAQLAVLGLVLGVVAALWLLPVTNPFEQPSVQPTGGSIADVRTPVPSDTRTPATSDHPKDDDDDGDNDNGDDAWPSKRLIEQAERVANLDAFANDPSGTIVAPPFRVRPSLLAARDRAQQFGDIDGLARLNSILSSEAFSRAARVTTRWLDRRDGPTGLFPHTLMPKGRYWSYGDVGSDLYPFLAIGTQQLLPGRVPEILSTLAAERGLTPGFPRDVDLDTLKPVEQGLEKQMLGNVEYAKDGLLPPLELLGPEPWRPRMEQIVFGVLAQSHVRTTTGLIPSDAAEVNGSLLQVLARLSWSSDDSRYVEMGRRIARAYLDDALPKTGDIPPQRWDFISGKPIDEPSLHLGDHGSEIVSGLIEWHRVEVRLNLPERTAHRTAINRMLDRLLQTGRTPDGLWYDKIRLRDGKVEDRGLNDNWGYLGQAYLNQAALLRTAPNQDISRAARYQEAARTMLDAVAGLDYFIWEDGEMDGYADTIESAIYLLHRLDDAETVRWVHEQIAVFYGFQHPDGAVTDENIDGNFVRTALLYGLWLTQGARVEPWSPGVSLGTAVDRDCLQLHLHADTAWTGRLRLDTPRHRQHLGLAEDYPRLNEWPEWWTVEPDREYAVTLPDGQKIQTDGGQLAAGLPLTLTPATEYRIRVCTAANAV